MGCVNSSNSRVPSGTNQLEPTPVTGHTNDNASFCAREVCNSTSQIPLSPDLRHDKCAENSPRKIDSIQLAADPRQDTETYRVTEGSLKESHQTRPTVPGHGAAACRKEASCQQSVDALTVLFSICFAA